MGKRIKRGRDVEKVMRRSGCPVRSGKGSHMIGTLPSGKKIVWYHGELSNGVRRKVAKALTAAGLIAIFILALAAGTIAALLVNGAI